MINIKKKNYITIVMLVFLPYKLYDKNFKNF